MKKNKVKKPIYKKIWFWVLVVVVVGAVGSSLGGDEDTPNTGGDTASNEVEKETEKTPEVVEFKIGDTVVVGDVTYVVHGVETADVVGNEFLNQKAKGIYLIIDVSVTNGGDDSLTVSDSFFTLLNDGKKFDADAIASTYITMDDGDSIWLESINPDITLRGKIAFDVSENVANSNDTKLQVQTGFWGTEKEIISLAR